MERIMSKRMHYVSGMAIAMALLLTLFGTTLIAAENGVYVVASDYYGNNNFLQSNGDRTLSQQEYLGKTPGSYYCYGNGAGDFDNDGDMDFMMGMGYSSRPKEIYLYEGLETQEQFGAPIKIGEWTQGSYPMDMAVADFDEDGNLDFVLTQYGTHNSELYLGDGDLNFSRSILSSVSPRNCVGADSADFDNDGHADFVSVPWYGETEIYVNLGDGTGNFVTATVPTYNGTSYWGASTADFDGDGIADLVCTTSGVLDFYKGIGDGNFDWLYRMNDYTMSGPPAADNYDFDGDGDQDIVTSAERGVALFLNRGDGTFLFSTTSYGGEGYARQAISTPVEPMTGLTIQEIRALRGWLRTRGMDLGVLPGIGSYDVILKAPGITAFDLMTLRVSESLFTIEDVELCEETQTIHFSLTVHDCYASPGDYDLSFSIDYRGVVLETEWITLTVLDPVHAAKVVADAAAQMLDSLDKPSWAPRMRNHVIRNLERAAHGLSVLYPNGYDDQTQTLADLIEQAIAAATETSDGVTARDLAVLRNALRYLIRNYERRIIPDLTRIEALTRGFHFVRLLIAFDQTEHRLAKVTGGLAEQVTPLLLDNATLRNFACALAASNVGAVPSLGSEPFED
jgi:hypothetical protein